MTTIQCQRCGARLTDEGCLCNASRSAVATTTPLRPANPITQPGVDGDGRAIRGWAVKDTDPELLEPDIQSAVDHWLDAQDGDVPETITMVGYVPMRLPPAQRLADQIIDNVYEALDNDFGPDPMLTRKEPDGPTPEIHAKALELAELIRSNYTPFWCEPSEVEEVVHTADYVEVSRD